MMNRGSPKILGRLLSSKAVLNLSNKNKIILVNNNLLVSEIK